MTQNQGQITRRQAMSLMAASGALPLVAASEGKVQFFPASLTDPILLELPGQEPKTLSFEKQVSGPNGLVTADSVSVGALKFRQLVRPLKDGEQIGISRR